MPPLLRLRDFAVTLRKTHQRYKCRGIAYVWKWRINMKMVESPLVFTQVEGPCKATFRFHRRSL